MYKAGQALFGRVIFRDGTMPSYDRPYLIVYVEAERLGVLNVSSLAGKTEKLLYPTNKNLIKYNPPFQKNTFVKLDSLVYISHEQAGNMKLLSNGKQLDSSELADVINHIVS